MGFLQSLSKKVEEQGPVGKAAVITALATVGGAIGIAAPFAAAFVGALIIIRWIFELR